MANFPFPENHPGFCTKQKTYTMDFLTKTKKVNEGEVPQYYAACSHPAIIDPSEWEAVQVEVARRKKLGRRHDCFTPFSGKVIYGDCGGVYGSKIWHSNSKYRHCVSAYCHYDEKSRGHMHYLFVPVFHDPKKDIYKVSANELVDRRALTTFHHDLSKAVEQDLGYEVSIMTGEATLRREQGLRGSIDILKYKAQKLAEEYATLKEKFQGSGLKLSAEMAQYIVRTGQKEQFAEYQRNNARQQGEERS